MMTNADIKLVVVIANSNPLASVRALWLHKLGPSLQIFSMHDTTGEWRLQNTSMASIH